MVKTCSACQETKPREAFSERATAKDGLRGQCKACRVTSSTAWIHNNRERYNARIRADRAKNPAKYHQWSKAYAERDPERYAAIKRSWPESNPERRTAISRRYTASHLPESLALVRRRQATKLSATPAWADLDLIKDLYRLAAVWSEATGTKYHVDHAVPLQSARVCGLHCEANLQILPARENRAKLNRWWPDMP